MATGREESPIRGLAVLGLVRRTISGWGHLMQGTNSIGNGVLV